MKNSTRTLIASAATVSLMGATVALAPSVLAADCKSAGTTTVWNPETGKHERAKVSTCADNANTTANSGTISSWPAVGTGGLILRDVNGRDLGSGIGEQQDFKFLSCGPKGSGLIKVTQLKRGGGGGWGSLYSGYVKQQWTQAPSMFPCN